MRTTMRNSKPVVATLLAATVALTIPGCDNSDATTPPSTPQTSTPASASPTTTPSTPNTSPKTPPPTIPAAATKGLTVTSAEAFARFYLAAVDYLLATGDAGLVRRWADRGCVACESMASRYSQIYKDGGAISGDFRVKILQVNEARLIQSDTAAVLIRASEGRQTEVARAGAKPKVLPGGPYTWDLTLAAANGRWAMFEMEQKP
jgi:hypothetical protein